MRSGSAILLVITTLAGCGHDDALSSSGSLALHVAALTLPGVDRVCYDLEVRAGPDATSPLVWSRDQVCSDRYGNGRGGDVSYVGTCDASAGPHRVEVRLTGLFRDGAPLNDWVAPPPFVRADVPCVADTDTPVEANFVVMRAAQQGFLDLAVAFDQIACSAKVDCQSGPEALLHDGGARTDTLVLALSCSDGDGRPPHLMMDEVVITCGDRVVAIDPSRGPGRFADEDPSGLTSGAQSHEGTHAMGSYWTLAIGLNTVSPPAPCTLTTRMTATRDDTSGDLGLTAFTTYPVIDVQVHLGTELDGNFKCGNLGLDSGTPDSTSWVETVYVERETTDEPLGAPFWACFDPSLPPDYTSVCASGSPGPGPDVGPTDTDATSTDTDLTNTDSADTDTTSTDATDIDTQAPPSLAPPPTLRELALGDDHACAIMSDGSLDCWGSNGAGQNVGKLGNGGSAGAFRIPGPVQGLGVVATVSAGPRHTCAVLQDGRTFCWGSDSTGQVGDGANSSAADDSVVRPAQAVDLADATSIATGWAHTCAATAAGAVWCWGGNSFYQLGAQAFPAYVPRQVVGVNDVSEVVATDNGTCALRSDHTVWCWGEHFANVPTPFGNLTAVSELAAGGDRLCAVLASGDASCWQAGVPEAVTLDQVVDLDVTQGHACAVRQGGSIWCWGANARGQLGDGTTTASSTPVQVPGLSGLTRVAVGGDSTCARDDDGHVWCWGRNDQGQLGLGTTLDHATPRPMDVLAIRPRQLSLGTGGCARLGHGQVDCWANNAAFHAYTSGDDNVAGAVLDPTLGGASNPPLSSVAEVAAGGPVACARLTDGTVRCAGSSQVGQLGDGANTSGIRFTAVLGLTSAVAIRVGGTHACALLADGTATCWGNNSYGQLGDGTLTSRLAPVAVQGLNDLVDLAAGNSHTCALTAQGEVFCWGTRSLAGGGAAPTGPIKVPIRVPNLSNITQIDTHQGGSFTCARDDLGHVWCWGLNGSGQLGDGTTTNSISPKLVQGLIAVSDLGVGKDFVTVARDDGTVACWGSSSAGKCGLNGTNNGPQSVTLAPVTVAGLSDVIEVAAGGHACARRTDHTVWCWGSALPIGAAVGPTASPTLALFR